MTIFQKIFLGDPLSTGAQIFTEQEVLKRLKSQTPEETVVVPYAKTVGFVLHPPAKKVSRTKRKKTRY